MNSRHSRILLLAGLLAAVAIALLLATGLWPPAEDAAAEPLTQPPVAAAGAGQDEPRAPAPPARASVTPTTGVDLAEVVIVRADTLAPVPGASVWWWPRPMFDGDDGIEDWLRRSAVEAHADAAIRLQADDRGRVLVADVEQGFFVAAASGDLWGCTSFDADRPEPAMVPLAPDLDIRVQVVDPDGAPVAGVPVALGERRIAAAIDHLTARTGQDGIAVLRHAGRFLRATPGQARAPVVAVLGLLDPPLERHLDRDPAPGEAVQFVLGPTGSCEVAVVDSDGQPLGGPLEAQLRFADAGVDRPGATLSSRTGAAVVFEHVALARDLAVAVTREGSDARLEARGPGPRRAGERVRLCVRAGVGSAILRGRLLDAAGLPAGELAVRARFEGTGGEPGLAASWSLRTAPDGRFSVETVPLAETPAGLQLAVCRLAANGAELAIARRPLPRELAAGAYDLGAFTLADTPVAAAGIVVDGDGNAIERAIVTPSIPPPRTEDGNAAPWPPCWLAPARSDAQGRFEIRGATESDAIALLAEKQGMVGDPLVVRVADRQVRLVLGAAATIEGAVLLEPSLLGTLVLVQADRQGPAAATAPAPGGSAGVVGRDGSFTLGGLQPGPYTLRVVFAANATELARIEDVTARAGETTRDRRLDPLDLRRAHQLIRLEPVDERGQPVANARAFSRPSGDATARWSFGTVGRGRLEVMSQGLPLDVAIAAPGFLRTELERVTASQRVVLRRAATLRLQLLGGLPVLEPPLRLGAELTPARPGHFASIDDATVAFFDARGVLTCSTAFAGELRLQLFVATGDRRSPSMVRLQEDAPRTIVAADHGSEQQFQIGLDPARLADTIRSLREPR